MGVTARCAGERERSLLARSLARLRLVAGGDKASAEAANWLLASHCMRVYDAAREATRRCARARPPRGLLMSRSCERERARLALILRKKEDEWPIAGGLAQRPWP